ncbi:hypothetical protein [Nonomuraea sp. NPDC050540]|uniref:hypothetical protein n=1 Tax=Nonomuraea sp. NPDC050540 TaxID=3364367 RepID=UPI00379297F4
MRWQGELEGSPEEVREAITVRADGRLWKIDYEPRVGGSETGLTAAGGTVTVWPRILILYGELQRIWPSPVVALNRAVALATVEGPAAAPELSDNAAEQEFLQERARTVGAMWHGVELWPNP